MSDDRLRGTVSPRLWWTLCIGFILAESGLALITLDHFLSGKAHSGVLHVLLLLGLAGGAGSLIYRSRPERNGT